MARSAHAEDGHTAASCCKMAGRTFVSTVGGATRALTAPPSSRPASALGDHDRFGPRLLLDALRAPLEGCSGSGRPLRSATRPWSTPTPRPPGRLRAGAAHGRLAGDATSGASEAAAEGCGPPSRFQARKGRASYTGPRSVGHQDPGATSTALMFAALEQARARRPLPAVRRRGQSARGAGRDQVGRARRPDPQGALGAESARLGVTGELAERLGLAKATVYGLLPRGLLEAHQAGRAGPQETGKYRLGPALLQLGNAFPGQQRRARPAPPVGKTLAGRACERGPRRGPLRLQRCSSTMFRPDNSTHRSSRWGASIQARLRPRQGDGGLPGADA